MDKLTRHPLYAKADALKRSFVINGFTLHDDGDASELQTTDWTISPYGKPEAIRMKPLILEKHGEYALRSELIAGQLHTIKGSLPLRAICAGRVYDANDVPYADHLAIEGAIAAFDIAPRHLMSMWTSVVKQTYGMDASAEMVPENSTTFRVEATRGDDSFIFAYVGRANDIARALLGIDDAACAVWIFTIDVDSLVMHDLGLKDRSDLYNTNVTFLERFEDNVPAFGNTFRAMVVDTLRAHGFMEFSGARLYREDAYLKMNMIMESWDLNNRGFFLKEPIGDIVRVPTVRTPALEDALEENYKAGEKSVRIFEVGHHFVSDAQGRNPEEKISLSIGAYGGDMDKVAFRQFVDAFLTDLGVNNHFFIPVDMAIPYDPSDCWILMDEKMQYLGGNFGTINQIALDRHELGVTAFMAQIELGPLEKKAEEEFNFIPSETF